MGAWDGFEEFVAIVEEGSVSGAARALNVPRATLSRRLGELENALGSELAHRTTRTFTLTRAGEILYERARAMLDTAQAARLEVSRLDGVPRGVLRVSVPGTPSVWRGDLIGDFQERYPEVHIELLATNRTVDLPGEQIDVVIRGGRIADETLVGRPLFRSHLVCVASPRYAENHGLPHDLPSLQRHECILSMAEDGRPLSRWPLLNGQSIQVKGKFASNSVIHRWSQVMRGHGIGLLPEQLVFAAEREGNLQRLLTDDVGDQTSVWILYLARTHQLPTVRAFVDHVVAWFANGPQEIQLPEILP